MRSILLVLLTLLMLGIVPKVAASQHLVQPGSDWSALDSRLRPGDVIMLLPGVHRTARFTRMQGERNKPIVIKSLDPNRPSVIADGRHGIRLDRPRHVRIENVIIRDCTSSGITINDTHSLKGAPGEADDAPQNVVIENVRIERIGPKSRRNGIQAHGVSQLQVKNCTIEGWAGAAIELVGCKDVTLQRVTCLGLEEFTQAAGIVARAGTLRLNVRDCRLENAGAVAIRLGGSLSLDQMRPPLATDAVKHSICEADSVNISRCLSINSPTLLSLSHAGRVRLGNITAVGITSPVIKAEIDHDDDRMIALGEFRVATCLFAWDIEMPPNFVQFAGGIDPKKVMWESNLWWSTDAAELRASLIEQLPGRAGFPSVTDTDPEFDAEWNPKARAAELYGQATP